MMAPTLHGPGLTLVPLGPGDVERFWQLMTEPLVRRFLTDDRTIARAEAAALIDDARAQAAQGFGLWGIFAAGGTWAGAIALQPVAPEPGYAPVLPEDAVEVLVGLDPERWGRGLAGGAVRTVEAHAAGLGLPVVHALIDVPNHRSAKLFRSLGYAELGRVPGRRYELDVFARAVGPEVTQPER